MRLIRFNDAGTPQLGAVTGDAVRPLDRLRDRYPTMLSLIESGDTGLKAVSSIIDSPGETIPLNEIELLAPLERPGKYLAIGMNYKAHVEEVKRMGGSVPEKQFWFNKQTSCVVGPYADTDPGVSEALDYEVELGVVIGREAKNVSVQEARDHVFGYLVCNDISARDWQMHSPTFTIGKSFDTHGPIGPWIVTADEIPDPHALRLRCYVNGELRQDGDTSGLVHNVWEQISYLSTAFTLFPGDLLATGTPGGVGVAMTPPQYLNAGDIVRCEIDGIGAIENKVLAGAADQPVAVR